MSGWKNYNNTKPYRARLIIIYLIPPVVGSHSNQRIQEIPMNINISVITELLSHFVHARAKNGNEDFFFTLDIFGRHFKVHWNVWWQ